MRKTNRLWDTTPDFLSGFTPLAKTSPEVTHRQWGFEFGVVLLLDWLPSEPRPIWAQSANPDIPPGTRSRQRSKLCHLTGGVRGTLCYGYCNVGGAMWIGNGPVAITTSGKERLMETHHFPFKDERDVRSRPHPCPLKIKTIVLCIYKFWSCVVDANSKVLILFLNALTDGCSLIRSGSAFQVWASENAMQFLN